jgi:integral membrane protein
VRASLRVYRFMATVIGFFLIVLICIGVPMKYALTTGTSAQTFGNDLTEIVGVMHGFLYMVFLVVAANLAYRARFPIWFGLLVLALGTIPFLSFVGEHFATKRVREDYPELAPGYTGANESSSGPGPEPGAAEPAG